MRQKRSFAGPTKGQDNPETIQLYNFEADESGQILIWDGNEYERAETWISSDDEYWINLEDAR